MGCTAHSRSSKIKWFWEEAWAAPKSLLSGKGTRSFFVRGWGSQKARGWGYHSQKGLFGFPERGLFPFPFSWALVLILCSDWAVVTHGFPWWRLSWWLSFSHQPQYYNGSFSFSFVLAKFCLELNVSPIFPQNCLGQNSAAEEFVELFFQRHWQTKGCCSHAAFLVAVSGEKNCNRAQNWHKNFYQLELFWDFKPYVVFHTFFYTWLLGFASVLGYLVLTFIIIVAILSLCTVGNSSSMLSCSKIFCANFPIPRKATLYCDFSLTEFEIFRISGR